MMIRSFLLSCALAVFGLVPVAVQAGHYTCTGGAQLMAGRKCSDGSIPLYQADEVKPNGSKSVQPYVAQGVQPYTGQGIQRHQSTEVKPLTKEERQRMMDNTNREAKAVAGKWTKNGKGLNKQQEKAIDAQTCLGVAAANSDLRCVPR